MVELEVEVEVEVELEVFDGVLFSLSFCLLLSSLDCSTVVVAATISLVGDEGGEGIEGDVGVFLDEVGVDFVAEDEEEDLDLLDFDLDFSSLGVEGKRSSEELIINTDGDNNNEDYDNQLVEEFRIRFYCVEIISNED